ncbi:hypothetical protein KJ762_11465 [bacterium]|nr:hypothetical protein [bacterium]MBU1635108.1 hypothetical protein [bacterium]MBU1875074.1 hypothetical protein [bacterium]
MYFGGYDINSFVQTTTHIYDLNTNSWSTDANSTNPSAREDYRMAETSMDGSGNIVLFGGYTSGVNDETWTFGGGDYSLPVTLSDFSAKVVSSSVVLNWSTESEIENLGFNVCRKSVGGDFILIADYLNIGIRLPIHPARRE